MTYVLGAALGAVIGAVAGFIKNRLIWVKYMNSETDPGREANRLYTRMLASNLSNIAILVIVFFTRELQPFDAAAYIVGAALALVVMNRTILTSQKKQLDKEAMKE